MVVVVVVGGWVDVGLSRGGVMVCIFGAHKGRNKERKKSFKIIWFIIIHLCKSQMSPPSGSFHIYFYILYLNCKTQLSKSHMTK